MCCTRLGFTLLAFAFTQLCACSAAAQPFASSLAEVEALALAKRAIVTSASGEEFRGSVTDASDSGLSLRVGDEIRRFAAADVRRVRVRQEDSPLNGALIGAGIAGALTSLIFLDNECRDDPACYQALAAYTAAGALAGLGIDALIHRHLTIYPPPAGGGTVKLIAGLSVVGSRPGVRLTIAWAR